VVKDHFKRGSDYTMYSFRHTFITKSYNELAKQYTHFEAKSRLMLIRTVKYEFFGKIFAWYWCNFAGGLF